MCCVYECHKAGHSGDGCDLGSIMCKYELSKGD